MEYDLFFDFRLHRSIPLSIFFHLVPLGGLRGFGFLLGKVAPHRGLALLVQLFLGKLPKRRRQHVRVPSLEKHKVSVICLFQRKVNAVFLRRAFKDFDIRIGDFDIGNSRAMPHKLFQRLLAATGVSLALR